MLNQGMALPLNLMIVEMAYVNLEQYAARRVECTGSVVKTQTHSQFLVVAAATRDM